jgi:hypothetical protein
MVVVTAATSMEAGVPRESIALQCDAALAVEREFCYGRDLDILGSRIPVLGCLAK